MVVSATAYYGESALDQFLCQHLGVLAHLYGPLLELRLQGLAEGHGLGGYHMLQRTTLLTREDSAVEQGAHHLYLTFGCGQTPRIFKVLAHEDDTATRTTKGLVGGRGHYVGILHRVLQQTGGYQTGRMGHVYHQQGTHLVGYGTHAGIVPLTAVGTATADDELWTMLTSQLLHLVVVHTAGLTVQVVSHGAIQYTGGVHQRAMREVTAMSQVQTHEGVAGFQHGQQHCGIGLSARVGLHVGILGIKELLHTVNGQLLHLVHHTATAVVALARIALGILVGQIRTHGTHHLVTNKILRGNEFHAFQLALVLQFDEFENLLVFFHTFCSLYRVL